MPVERPNARPVSEERLEQQYPPGEATSKPATMPELVVPEAVRPPPEGATAEIAIVDVATLVDGLKLPGEIGT